MHDHSNIKEHMKVIGADASADELRSLQAYRPIASIRQRRLLGALLFILSIASLSLLLFVPE